MVYFGKIKKLLFFLVCSLIFFAGLIFVFQTPQQMSLEVLLSSQSEDTFQVYYLTEATSKYSEEHSVKYHYSKSKEYEALNFKLKINAKEVRFDLGNLPSTIMIDRISVNSFISEYKLNIRDLSTKDSNEIKSYEEAKNGVRIETIGSDPYLFINIPESVKNEVIKDNTILKYFISILVGFVLGGLSYLVVKHRREIIDFLTEIYKNRSLIYQLSINDFRTRFAGSYFGVLWAFVQPVITVLIYWFVFEVGFRSGAVQEVPFILWLVAGIVPWFFFAEALGNSTNALIEYSYLVKKVVFQIRILPMVKIISSLYVHIFFVLFTIVLFLIYGYYPNIGYLQLIYYTFCAYCIAFSVSLITSSLVVFFKDLGQIISLALQFGMWLTPILWHYSMLPASYQWILKINPIYYVVEGYRESLISNIGFWEHYNQTIYFWAVTGFLFLIGIIIMRKLKPHFADVL